MSDSEEEELEQNENVHNISVFRKREKIHASDDQQIEMDSLKKLNHMLTCPICLDIFQEPVYVKGCSHRFCKDCIEKAIRSSKTKQCPTCRKIIGTKRLLRVDFNVQEIISMIYGDINKFLEQKQSNDEILLSKTYQQLNNNADATTKKKRKSAANSGIEKGQDGYPQSSPNYSNIKSKEDSNDNGIIINEGLFNTQSAQNEQTHSRETIPFPETLKRRGSSNVKVSQNSSITPLYTTQKNQSNEKSNEQQSTSRKRKYDNLNNTNNNSNNNNSTQKESTSKKENETLSLHMNGFKKRYFDEEYKEKQQEENMRNKINSQFDDNNSAKKATSLQKIERAFINIQIKVIPYDKLQKQFDFHICKLDWTLTLEDITKLICQKLSLNYMKYKQQIKFFTKSQREDSFYHPLEDKTQLIKNVEDQFWCGENKYKYIRPYDKNEQAINIQNDYIHQKAASHRILYYVIEHRDTFNNL